MFLYQLFNEQDDLLYIGITVNPRTRFYQHAGSQPWWHEVARREVEELPDESAAATEKAMIVSLRPRYNVHHQPIEPLQRVELRISADIVVAAKLAAHHRYLPLNAWMAEAFAEKLARGSGE